MRLVASDTSISTRLARIIRPDVRQAGEPTCSCATALVLAVIGTTGCQQDKPTPTASSASAAPAVSASVAAVRSAPPPPKPWTCPSDMVLVPEKLCVDRYEAHLVDKPTGKKLSPYYPVRKNYGWYVKARKKESADLLDAGKSGQASSMPFPALPGFQYKGGLQPQAIAKAGVTPNAYVNYHVAKRSCEAVGKRLCAHAEWTLACKGEGKTKHPYGDDYKQGQCNVFRERHPGNALYGNASVGMLDPRMNRVRSSRGPLLRKTGTTKTCASRWGDDAIYDMVGNLDEWIDDPKGTFVGGFYARSTKNGCEAKVSAHVPGYQDYSTGVRCCADAKR